MPPKIRKKSETAGVAQPDQVMVGLQTTYVNYRQSARRDRALAFFDAFKFAEAPVGEGLKATAEAPAFESDEAKYTKLSEEMNAFLDAHASTDIAATARLVLASSHMELGKYEEALALLEQFLAEQAGSPLLPLVYENLGYACMHLGKTEEAVGHFEKMQSISADAYLSARALVHLGDLFNPGAVSAASAKDAAKAREYYQKALEALPEKEEGEEASQRFPAEEQTRQDIKVRLALLEIG